MMVGNGVTNWDYDTIPAYIELANAHSFIDPEVYAQMKALDCKYPGYALYNSNDKVCDDLLAKFNNDVGAVNVYDTLGKCYIQNGEKDIRNFLHKEGGLKFLGGEPNKQASWDNYTPWMTALKKGSDGLGVVPPCVDGAPVVGYLNKPEVLEALHIPSGLKAWDMCEDDIDYTVLPIGS
jgi:hypothetical protein